MKHFTSDYKTGTLVRVFGADASGEHSACPWVQDKSLSAEDEARIRALRSELKKVRLE